VGLLAVYFPANATISRGRGMKSTTRRALLWDKICDISRKSEKNPEIKSSGFIKKQLLAGEAYAILKISSMAEQIVF